MLVGNIPDTLTVNPTADSTLYEFIVDYGSIQIVDSVMIYTEPTNAGPDVVLDCNTNVVQLLATGVSTTNGVYAWN
ncbi:MAG: hypothetical protein ACPG4Y_10995, partial [Chitinophagales bacterium]